MNFKTFLYYFFFADIYRITIMTLLTLGLILFVLVMILTCRAKLKFTLIFIVMINAMISGILSPLGYYINWVIEYPDTKERKLLFGESRDLNCQMQSFILATFQCSRESFVTLIMAISFVKARFPEINLQNNKINLAAVLMIGYGIPIIASIVYTTLGAFGESHLFCFTSKEVDKYPVVTCGLIHFIYIIILILLSIFFTFSLIKKLKEYKNEKNENNINESDGKYKEINLNKCIFCHPRMKKIIFFPIAQIISMSLPIYYRITDWFIKRDPIKKSGPAAIMNAVSSIIYTAIFVISNDYLKQTEVISGQTELSCSSNDEGSQDEDEES